MRLEDIQKEAKQDRYDHDTMEFDTELLRIPNLHHKWIGILTEEKNRLIQLKHERSTLRRKKWAYYTGKMSQEELEQEGWEPFDLKVLKTDIQMYLDADADLQKKEFAIEYQDNKIAYVEGVLKEIMSRQWTIRSAIDYVKFVGGEVRTT
jgi:hypothetical protein